MQRTCRLEAGASLRRIYELRDAFSLPAQSPARWTLSPGSRGPLGLTRYSTRRSLLVGAALLFLSTFPDPAPAQTVSFIARRDFAAGRSPDSVAVGDFNGDGKLDLAVANLDSSDVSVLLGKGDGSFEAGLTFGVGGGPYSVAVGDFNGDGKLDLAVASRGSSLVSVLLGNGDGTFQAALTFAGRTGTSSVAVGDFNGDGKLDLVVADLVAGDSASVSVLLGNGDGTFQAALNSSTGGSRPASVAVGDFNGDGKLDLAVANPVSGRVSVRLGNGEGRWGGGA